MKTLLNNIVLLSNLLEILLVLAIILLLPQISMQEYVLPTITSKTICFLYVSTILLIVYGITIVFLKKISFSFSKIDIALLLLLIYITLNRYFIQSQYGFSIRYIELLGLSFFYIVLRSISLKNYPWILLAIVTSGIIQAVYGNLQLLGFYSSNHSGFKITGSFFNPGPYAGFLGSVWAIALGMYLFRDTIITQKHLHKKKSDLFIKYIFEYIPLLGIITIAIVLPATQSRASWIAVVVSSLILIELKYSFLNKFFKKGSIKFQKKTLILLVIGIVSVILFTTYNYKKDSSDGRVFIWKITSKMITDTPFFGLGFDRFKTEYMNYQADYFAKNGETAEALVADNVYYTFNEGLQFVAENGFVGLVFLFAVVYFLFQTRFKEEHRTLLFVSKIGLLTIGIFSCFSYPMQIVPIKMILVILAAFLSNSNINNSLQIKIFTPNTSSKDRKTEKIAFSILFKSIIIFLVSITVFLTIDYTKKISLGFITWNNALNSHQFGNYEEAIEEFESVYPILRKEGDFLMNYGKTLSLAGKHYKAIAVLKQAQHYQNNTIIATALGDSYKATNQYDKAEVAYQQAVNMTPAKFYPNYLLVKLYDDSGQEKKAIALAKILINKEIKIPSTAIREIKEEMKKILIKYKILQDL